MGRQLVLLLALVVFVVAQPSLARVSDVVAELSDAAFGVLCLAIFLSLCRTGWERWTGIALFGPVLASHLAVHSLPGGPHPLAATTFHVTTILFLGFAVVMVVRLLARITVIGGDDVLGAVCGYVLAALTWSHLYALAYMFAPGAFDVSPAVAGQLADWRTRRVLFEYFSFTSLTSIGFSDITAVAPPMYAITVIETIFGQFYMAVVVAQLVGLKLAQASSGHEGPRVPLSPTEGEAP
jgi:hypothetical protein